MGVKDAVVERFNELYIEYDIRVNELANRSGVTPLQLTAYLMCQDVMFQ